MSAERFSSFVFHNLGARLDFSLLVHRRYAVYLSLFVLIGNPLIVMLIMGIMGYRKRTGFLAGLTVAQISNFHLFWAPGVSLGHITMEAMSHYAGGSRDNLSFQLYDYLFGAITAGSHCL